MNETADALIRSYTADYKGRTAAQLIDEVIDMLDFFGYTARRNGLWLETEEGRVYRFSWRPIGWVVRDWTI